MEGHVKRRGMWLAFIGMILLLGVFGACSDSDSGETQGTGAAKGTKATTMRLVKTTGDVSVDDDDAKAVKIINNLKLFSGYHIATEKKSYAWINLDDVKLTKMDADSEVTIQKEGKKLELFVNSGSLYFHVTEPLADDETMNIRTATMIIGIRGTEGWVEVLSENHVRVSLLEGEVECSVLDEDGNVLSVETIRAGETADMVYESPDGFITTEEMQTPPVFVQEETEEENPAENRFSLRFGGVVITELPMDVSVLEKDGWVIEEAESDGITYAFRDGDYIGLKFDEDSKNLIQTVYLRNGNYLNGVFDIRKITLFDTVDFYSSVSSDISNALDPNGEQKGYLYDCLMDNYDTYYYEIYHIKGLSSCCIVKDSDTDFNIVLSCEVINGEGSSGGAADDGGSNEDSGRPQTVEYRWYKSAYDEYEAISVEIFDTGGWYMQIEGWGAMAIYISYSFDEEAAGSYAQVSGYNLGGEEPEFEYMGRAKFKMTEDELLMQYEDEDEPTIYYRAD